MELKNKKPKFRRENSNKLKRLRHTDHWRKPKGTTSSLRLNRRGYPKLVRKGYGAPKSIKTSLPDGKFPFYLSSLKNLNEVLNKINPSKYEILISSRIGIKKRLMLLNSLKDKKFKVFNVENIDEEIERLKRLKLDQKKKHDFVKKKKNDKVKRAKSEKTLKTKKEHENNQSSKNNLDAEKEKNLDKDQLTKNVHNEEKKELDKILTHKK